jgi:hypothetical protein
VGGVKHFDVQKVQNLLFFLFLLFVASRSRCNEYFFGKKKS